MSRSYWRVAPAFWGDEKVVTWNDDTRLLALYLLTCEHRSLEGLFRLPKGYIAEDLGWTAKRLAEPFDQLLRDGFILYDEPARVCFIVHALEYQAPENGNQVTCAMRLLAELPATPLFAALLDQAEQHCQRLAEGLRERFPERFYEGLPDPLTPTPTPAPAPAPVKSPNGLSSGEPDMAAEVFAYWQEVMGHPQAKLKGDRRQKIQLRLKEGYSAEQLKQAVDGCRASPHHRGENDTGTVYDSIGLIFRNAEKVEWFMALAQKGALGQPRPDPQARQVRIERARSALEEGYEDLAKGFVNEDEWLEVCAQ